VSFEKLQGTISAVTATGNALAKELSEKEELLKKRDFEIQSLKAKLPRLFIAPPSLGSDSRVTFTDPEAEAQLPPWTSTRSVPSSSGERLSNPVRMAEPEVYPPADTSAPRARHQPEDMAAEQADALMETAEIEERAKQRELLEIEELRVAFNKHQLNNTTWRRLGDVYPVFLHRNGDSFLDHAHVLAIFSDSAAANKWTYNPTDPTFPGFLHFLNMNRNKPGGTPYQKSQATLIYHSCLIIFKLFRKYPDPVEPQKDYIEKAKRLLKYHPQFEKRLYRRVPNLMEALEKIKEESS
jgi:hypothetical protein